MLVEPARVTERRPKWVSTMLACLQEPTFVIEACLTSGLVRNARSPLLYKPKTSF